jgi:hypothetical protein
MESMEKGKVCVLSWIFFLQFFNVSASENDTLRDSLRAKKIDTAYISPITRKLILGIDIERHSNVVEILNYQTPAKPLSLQTNTPHQFLAQFNYRWLFFRIGLLQFSRREKQYGTSDFFQIGFSIIGRRIISHLAIQSFNGFYVTNPSQFLTQLADIQNLQLVQRGDLINTKFHWLNLYNFNHRKFSYRAIVGGNEIQKKSAGAFLAGFSISSNVLFSDQNLTFVADTLQSFFNTNASSFENYHQSIRQESATAGLTLGYAHTFVLKNKVFISLMLLPTLANQSGNYTDSDFVIRTYPRTAIQQTEGRLTAGYNKGNHFIGLQYQFISYANREALIPSLNDRFTFFRLNYAYRFTPPKWIKKVLG